jgi:hypothetical protein
MKRHDLEHVIRAATAITNETEFVIIGSQSILGAIPDAPDCFLLSREVDIYPLRNPDKADLIEGAIGELSAFDEHYKYYAQAVGPNTAILPEGWMDRLVKVSNPNTNGGIGYCLAPVDLAVSKLAAGREKDFSFVQDLIEHQILTGQEIREKIDLIAASDQIKHRIRMWIDGVVAK